MLFFLNHEQQEYARQIKEISHPIIRETLSVFYPNSKNLIINCFSSIPSRTGLGSSGCFTVGLIKALSEFYSETLSKRQLAQRAFAIEAEYLKKSCGIQDQYIASFGGLTVFNIQRSSEVEVIPLKINKTTNRLLEKNLCLFFTGIMRDSETLLLQQKIKSLNFDKAMLDNLHYIDELGRLTQKALITGDLELFCQLMNEHWQYKRKRNKAMSNQGIDRIYELAIKNGALAGKLVGAGGGGFMLFYANDKERLRKAMQQLKLVELTFSFDINGAKVIEE